MARFAIIALALAAAAYSAGSRSNQQSVAAIAASEEMETQRVVAARHACKQREHKEMDTGISDYEACLGERANLTRPADQQLCEMAKSTMSAEGICVLGE